ncbi:hypothetical protein Sango_2825100 [Sesamum angolense]|uniref:Glutaredoxin family protein n=1 Tax=Sesamum angolense TaxID=2727404 RepID=A0AAE1T796_9LAMI|nr:hypothetical protein Sango_2825100 [Sesamum angolense]
MGCSASRPANFVTQQQNPISNSSSSFSNSQLQSPYYSFSDPSSTPVSRTLSLPTPLVHHPPLRKGDSNHFVSLTSTTYGSLVLVDPPNPSFDGQDFANQTAQMGKIQDFGDEEMDARVIVKSYEFVENPVSKPLWKHLSEESLLAKMDYNVVSSYQKALLGRHNGCEKPKDISESQKAESLECNDVNNLVSDSDKSCYLVGAEGLGLECALTRGISMDRSYRTELQDALKGQAVSLPQVFVKGKYIGGAEEIKQLNETGELAKLLEGFPLKDQGCVCVSCGDARFVPCPNCNGSQKVYEEEEGKLRRCPDCNENGLVRCSGCCP